MNAILVTLDTEYGFLGLGLGLGCLNLPQGLVLLAMFLIETLQNLHKQLSEKCVPSRKKGHLDTLKNVFSIYSLNCMGYTYLPYKTVK